jgi:hypothetical protein
MAGPLRNMNTGASTKIMYGGPASLADRPTYAENDPRLQVRQQDPGGLLARMDPNDLMALRNMGGTDMYTSWVNNLKGKGFSDQDIYQLTNEGRGAGNQAAMGGDWLQQVQQHYGANATASDVFAGTNYAQFFPKGPGIPPATPNAPGSVGAKSGAINPITGAPDPTNGVWNVNTAYQDANGQATGTTPASTTPANTNGQVWNPNTAFTTVNSPAAPPTTNNGLTTQLNGQPPTYQHLPTAAAPPGGVPQFRSPQPAGPVSGNHNGGGGSGNGYSFVAPGWNGTGVNWRSGTAPRQF